MTKLVCKEERLHQTIIENKRGWQMIDWQELFQYRDLFYFFVLRDIKILYKQTILGFAWAIIKPLVSMVIFTVIFGRLAKMPSDGVPYPIFSFTALVPWTYFVTAMTDSSSSLVNNTNVLSKIYFPRLIIPMTPVLAKLLDFHISFVMLVVMMAWYKYFPSIEIIALPFLVVLMVITASGIGMWLSAAAIHFRDVKHIIPFLSQILMYAAPVVWPVSLIPPEFRIYYGLYPMAGVIEGFRSCLLSSTSMPWDLIISGGISAVIIYYTGALYFRRLERSFADVA